MTPKIPTITLNNSNQIPQLGFGTFRIPDDEAGTKAILNAIQLGYRHIDTAYNYKKEKNIAEAIKLSGVPREDFFITTKVGFQKIIERQTRESVLESMSNLSTNYLDMVLLHWAATNYVDAYKELLAMQSEGLIKNVGVSNFQEHHIEKLKEHNLPMPAVNQIELHVKFQEKSLVEYCQNNNIKIEAWSPLGGRDYSIYEAAEIIDIAKKYQKTPAQIVLRWHIQNNFIIFPKSTQPERQKENLDIFDFCLSEDDMNTINQLDENRRLYWDPLRWD